jgi:L-malate glycosyltransferase
VRILYFSRDYSPHDHRFLSALAGTEHQVFFLRLERKNSVLEDQPVPAGVTLVPWRGGQGRVYGKDYPALYFDLKRVIRNIKPDLIHAGPIQNAAFLTALTGFHPLVSMSWGSDLLVDAGRNPRMKRITQFTLHRTDVLVGDCQAVSSKAQTFGFPQERIVLFPWGVDLAHFSPQEDIDLRKRLGWEDAFILLSLRSWEPLYGVDQLVSAFIKTAREIPELRLFLLGGGSQAGKLHEIIDRNGLLDKVYFGGYVKQADLPLFYRASDLYLSASHSDGSSVSLMEALACGLPVLVSDIPGNREWISNGSQGWLFSDGRQHDIEEGISKAYERRGQLQGMGQSARRLAEERADWSQNFQKLLGAYEMASRP